MKIAVLAVSAFMSFSTSAQAQSDEKLDQSILRNLARSVALIRTSTSDRPNTLRVLFYGQSITSPKWTDGAVAHLKSAYPTVQFIIKNAAIGGFDANRLERTVERDLAEFYPDLIVFHVYGDHRTYERIIRLMRQKTAADIILQTDHVTKPVEPICHTGLHLKYSPPPGCTGHFWFKQRHWEDYMSDVFVPMVAKQYQLAVEPRRHRWNEYLKRNNLAPEVLLSDDIHPNERGWELATEIFSNWFDAVVRSWNGESSNAVQEVRIATKSLDEFEFTGNRVEIVSTLGLDGMIAATIDGKLPKDIDGCWATSRTTSLPNVPDWPSLRQVTVNPAIHSNENWTVTLTNLNPSNDRFDFSVDGSMGPDGKGHSGEDFVSPSGRVRIASTDWMTAAAYKLSGKVLPEGFQIHWRRLYLCGDQVSSEGSNSQVGVRNVVGTGLASGRHTISLSILPERQNSVQQMLVYRPFLN